MAVPAATPLSAPGVKNTGTPSQDPQTSLEVENAAENAVGNGISPRYLSPL